MNRVFCILVALACFAVLAQVAVQAQTITVDSGVGANVSTYNGTGESNLGPVGVTQGITISATTGPVVPSAIGAVDILGVTIGITGVTTLTDTLNANGNVNLGDAIGDATVVSGTLGVAGLTSLSTLDTSGLAVLSSVNIVNGAIIGDDLGVTGAVTVGGLLTGNGGQVINGGSAIWSGAGVGNRAIVDGTGASMGNGTSSVTVTTGNTVALLSDNDLLGTNARSALTMNPTSTTLLVNTNSGVAHGLDINQTRTILSGGTSSTALILDDSGATFENEDTGGPARVHGVADGISAFDAVNVRQLNSRFNGLKEDLSSGIASVAALAAIPGPVPGKCYSAGIGYGNFGGESAFAVGVKAYLAESDVSLAAGVGFANDDTTVNAGASFSW